MPMNRPVQYSLRFLLIAILMVASFCGGIAFQNRKVNEMRNAMKQQMDSSAAFEKKWRITMQELMDAQQRAKQLEAGGHASGGAAQVAQ